MLHDFSDTVAFVKVVQEGGFTAAARALKVPKTRVSRKVQELEHRLDAGLLNRTTRSAKLTEAGAVYFQHCAAVVKDLEDAEHAVADLQKHPRGWLRIAASFSLGRVLGPILSEFRRFYPDVYPQLLLSPDVVDIVAADLDVAFRLWEKELPNSTLVGRRLGAVALGIYAAPAYLERAGSPNHPSELARHACLVLQMHFDRPAPEWSRSRNGERKGFAVRAVAVASETLGLHPFLLAEEGLMLAACSTVAEDVAAGRVVRVLPDWAGPELALYALRPSGRIQPPKVKALLDFLVPRLDLC